MKKLMVLLIGGILATNAFGNDSLNIKSVGHWHDNHVWNVIVKDTIAYVGAYNNLCCVDVSNPASPQLLGELSNPDRISDMELKDTIVYIGDCFGGLQIVNVASPTTPQLICEYNVLATPNFSTAAYGVAVVGSYAYVAWNDSGLCILDISVPQTPVREGLWDLAPIASQVHYVKVKDKYAYVTERFSGLNVVDISDPNQPVYVTHIGTPGEPLALNISKSYCYVENDSGVSIFNIATPSSPTLISTYKVRYPSIYIVDTLGYICHNNTIQVVNFAKPSAPTILAYYTQDSISIEGIFALGNYIYVAADDSGLIIFELCKPAIEENADCGKLNMELKIGKNPITNLANISYTIPFQSNVELNIYDITGKLVDKIVNKFQSAGSYSLNWSASDKVKKISAGIYFIKLSAGGYKETRKFVVMK
ncbi:MAG: T9SS type A sorting domain-containing protein [bacterium]|nr:T9SS type A sorting domain-containing protein [bacterium]